MPATPGHKVVGLTRDAGWQFGLRKTFPYAPDRVWEYLSSAEGLKAWLGPLQGGLLLDKTFRTANGIEGAVSVLAPYSHIRMRWKLSDWSHDSQLQLRVMAAGNKTVISFHHDHLRNADEREQMKAWWNDKMQQVAAGLAAMP